jgi:hypothetical protein
MIFPVNRTFSTLRNNCNKIFLGHQPRSKHPTFRRLSLPPLSRTNVTSDVNRSIYRFIDTCGSVGAQFALSRNWPQESSNGRSEAVSHPTLDCAGSCLVFKCLLSDHNVTKISVNRWKFLKLQFCNCLHFPVVSCLPEVFSILLVH